MAIEITRLYTREKGGKIEQNSPSNFTFEFVIEATADSGDSATTYIPHVVCIDWTALSLAGAFMTAGITGVPLVIPSTPAPSPWVQPLTGGRFELEQSYNLAVPAGSQAGVKDHQFKYYVSLVNAAGGPTDADAAESEILILH